MEKPRRPVLFENPVLDSIDLHDDPGARQEIAQKTALAIYFGARATNPKDSGEQVSAAQKAGAVNLQKILELVENEGLDTLAQLWADCPPDTLAGVLWRLFALHEWARRDPRTLSERYRLGVTQVPVQEVIAGLDRDNEPADLQRLLEAILSGAFTGDLCDALDRAAAFCKVLVAGILAEPVGVDSASYVYKSKNADALARTAEELRVAASLDRAGKLIS